MQSLQFSLTLLIYLCAFVGALMPVSEEKKPLPIPSLRSMEISWESKTSLFCCETYEKRWTCKFWSYYCESLLNSEAFCPGSVENYAKSQKQKYLQKMMMVPVIYHLWSCIADFPLLLMIFCKNLFSEVGDFSLPPHPKPKIGQKPAWDPFFNIICKNNRKYFI